MQRTAGRWIEGAHIGVSALHVGQDTSRSLQSILHPTFLENRMSKLSTGSDELTGPFSLLNVNARCLEEFPGTRVWTGTFREKLTQANIKLSVIIVIESLRDQV